MVRYEALLKCCNIWVQNKGTEPDILELLEGPSLQKAKYFISFCWPFCLRTLNPKAKQSQSPKPQIPPRNLLQSLQALVQELNAAWMQQLSGVGRVEGFLGLKVSDLGFRAKGFGCRDLWGLVIV